MPPPTNQWILPSATYCWNCASVGVGSVPLNPPIAITGSSARLLGNEIEKRTKKHTVWVTTATMKDGTVSWNPPKGDPRIIRPAGPIDPEVEILYAAGAGDGIVLGERAAAEL